MPWHQPIDPIGSLPWSATVAAIPIVFIFCALIFRMKGYVASLLTVIVALVVAAWFYHMPPPLAILSAIHGAIYGVFPICWIIVGAVFIYNVTVESGQFEVIRNFMASITPDRRLQAILIAFSFGAFLEGAAGFGAPVAITAAMLAGLGFNPLYAAGICLIANTAPVAFGAVGTPILTAARVSDLPELAISQMVGRTLPLLSVVVPLYLVVLMSGWKRSLEVLPAILVSGISFAFFQWLTSNFLGPLLPDVIAGIASIVCLMILLKIWRPATVWRFKEEPNQTLDSSRRHTSMEIVRAWTPFFIMTLMIIAWGIDSVKVSLNSIGVLKFMLPGLADSIVKADGTPLAIKALELNYLSNPGSALFIASWISVPISGLSFGQGVQIFGKTLKQLRFPILTIASVLAFAFVANHSGMSTTMAVALASTGALFPFFSPMLGWLGVFLTGSDTSSNALFCKLQQSSAAAINIDPLITVSANASGGVTGKMISPQSIAIGAAAVGLVGKESDLFRFTFKHSFIMLLIVAILTMAQAYVIQWVVPGYSTGEQSIVMVHAGNSRGFVYLSVLAMVLAVLVLTMRNRRQPKIQ